MKGYSGNEVFTLGQQIALDLARGWVDALPERDGYGKELRCHEVARIIARKLRNETAEHRLARVVVQDGYFGIVEHSWLELFSVASPMVILDVYSVGRLPVVQLIAADTKLKYDKLFEPGDQRTDIRYGVVESLGG